MFYEKEHEEGQNGGQYYTKLFANFSMLQESDQAISIYGPNLWIWELLYILVAFFVLIGKSFNLNGPYLIRLLGKYISFIELLRPGNRLESKR